MSIFDDDLSYLEYNLPEFLQESIDKLKEGYKKICSGEKYLFFDCDIDRLTSAINVAEVEDIISKKQASYLRGKYLYEEEWN